MIHLWVMVLALKIGETPRLLLNMKSCMPPIFLWSRQELLRDSDLQTNNDLSEESHFSFIEQSSDSSGIPLEFESLYVLAPEDTNDLTIADLETVWKYREDLCGSLEVAAEVLALLDKARSPEQEYYGWKHYVDSPEIRILQGVLPTLADILGSDLPSKSEDAESVSENPFRRFTRGEVANLSISDVQQLWNRRPNSFDSISAACEALARLRAHQGLDTVKQSWGALVSHESIRPFYDELDDDTQVQEPDEDDFDNLLKSDNRQKISSRITIREGQPRFRERLIKEYGTRCCITGCQEGDVIEAAHIVPYSGIQSNILENGLLMRVDIHRLFDKHLLTIEPEKLVILISESIRDGFYCSLEGTKLRHQVRKKTKRFLKTHYCHFLELNPSQK